MFCSRTQSTFSGLAFVVLLLVVLPAPDVFATVVNERLKLLPNDGATEDWFGKSVGISDTTAIVGTVFDDENGTDSGSAYLFDTATGSRIASLLPSDGAEEDRFGWSAGISGTTAIVGAPGNDDLGDGSGAAYLSDTTTGSQITKLMPTDGSEGERFGFSVGISGNTAIVGAPFDDDNLLSGSAYLFDVTTGAEIAKLLPIDGSYEDLFGWSVATSGNTAIVGSVYGGRGPSFSGAAYLFDVTTGQQIAKLTPDDAVSFNLFGQSVAIDGGTAIVGARGNDENGENSGAAYLFDVASGAQIAKLLPSDGAPGAQFGWSVGISDNKAIVGAWDDDDNGNASGSAYLFDITAGAQLAKLLPSDGTWGDLFGFSVGISGSAAISGAIGRSENGRESGAAYLFVVPEPGTLALALIGGMFGVAVSLRRGTTD